jgi:hypothetical protein
MKKVLKASFITACTVVLFASCNKDYTCTCNVQSANVTHTITTDMGTTTQSNAQNNCDRVKASYADQVNGVTADCHL